MICPAATPTPRRPLLYSPTPSHGTHKGRIIRKKNGFSHTTASSVFYGCILTRQRARQQAISLRRAKFWRYVRRDEMIDGGVNFRAAPVEWSATHGEPWNTDGSTRRFAPVSARPSGSYFRTIKAKKNNLSAFSSAMKSRQKKNEFFHDSE